MKYGVEENKKKTKNPSEGLDVCVLCCRETNAMRTEDMKVHNGLKNRTKERKKRARKKSGQEYFFLRNIQTDSAAQAASYSMGTGFFSLGKATFNLIRP
jgi:hypothetical protein